jgi:hypothetical protein
MSLYAVWMEGSNTYVNTPENCHVTDIERATRYTQREAEDICETMNRRNDGERYFAVSIPMRVVMQKGEPRFTGDSGSIEITQ